MPVITCQLQNLSYFALLCDTRARPYTHFFFASWCNIRLCQQKKLEGQCKAVWKKRLLFLALVCFCSGYYCFAAIVCMKKKQKPNKTDFPVSFSSAPLAPRQMTSCSTAMASWCSSRGFTWNSFSWPDPSELVHHSQTHPFR